MAGFVEGLAPLSGGFLTTSWISLRHNIAYVRFMSMSVYVRMRFLRDYSRRSLRSCTERLGGWYMRDAEPNVFEYAV